MERPAFLDHPGEMARRIAGHDWSRTLGPISSWPTSLRTTVGLIIRSATPMILLWGADGVMIYNDAYAALAGDRNESLLGIGLHEGWPEIADFNDHVMRVVLSGQTLAYRDQEHTFYRSGRHEQVWLNLDYSPAIDDSGRPAGVIAVVVETTERVAAERRADAERQRQLRMLRQTPGFAAVVTGPDFVYEFVNQAFVAISRRTDFIGRRLRDVFPDIAGQGFFELLDRVWRTGEAVVSRGMEVRLHGEETPQYIDFVLQPISDDGTITGIFIGGYEVTDAYRANAALRESEARLRLALEASDIGAFVWYPDADRAEADPRALAIFDLPPEAEKSLASALAERIHPEDGPMYAASVAHALEPSGEGRLQARMRIRLTDGSLRWVAVTAQTEFAAAPRRAIRLVGAVRDITEAELAEEALRASETRYRTLFEAIEVGFCLIDMIFDEDGDPVDYAFVEANPAFERQAGFVHVSGRRMREIVPDHEPHWFDLYGRVATTGESARVEAGSGSLGRWWDVHAFKVGGPASRRVAVLCSDATARYRNELALRELNDTLERRVAEALAERKVLADIVEGTDALMLMVDADGRWLAVNRAAADEFERVYGARPVIGQPMAEAFQGEPEAIAGLEALWARAFAGEVFTETGSLPPAGRDERFYEMKFSPLRDAEGRVIGAYQFVYDITERHREQARLALAEEQLRQSRKMEAMGQLTGGVAHDFNNLLTPIVGSLDILQRRGVGGEREQRLIAGAMQSAERAKTLVQRLLAFARRQPLQPTAVDVGALVKGMADLVASTSGPQIKVTVEVAPDMPPARADPNQLEMALLNLSVNARDAMPDGGHLRISASAEDVGTAHHTQLPPGRYVRLSVADDGEGMDEATLARAVEPFFSTKGLGKGTGLGLSMVHGLALQLGGAMTIHARRGLGTNVELWLPPSTDAVAAPLSAPAAEGPVLNGVALLVDDEDLVRASTSEMLQELGYSVLQASSAEEALRKVNAGLRPNVLVTDHLMPGMSGVQLARALQNTLPGLPVLIVSGYAELEGIDPDLARLTKPFRNDDLAASLVRLLSKPAGDATPNA
ncbi:PAS domain-containing protein [Phenylobacterium sp. LjRoot225]|uniref:PAS domain-containing protein n=1 Tax=Phenylobacterium sp. LjRoot225 TaxID=3342285 RepID=UPI003ECFB648